MLHHSENLWKENEESALSMGHIFVLPNHDMLDVDEEILRQPIVIIKELFIVNIIPIREEDEFLVLMLQAKFSLSKIILAMSLDL